MIGILAFIAIFIAAFFAYRAANDSGRSGPLWGLATIGVGIGFQVIFPLFIGVIMAVVYLLMGVPAERLDEKISGTVAVIGFVSLFLSFVGIWFILRHISKIPDDDPVIAPPPPPTFDTHE